MFKACGQCDIRDSLEGIEGETVRGSAQPGQLDVSIWSDADIIGKLALEVKFGRMRDAAKPLARQGFIQMAVDEIEHSAESLGIGLFVMFLHWGV